METCANGSWHVRRIIDEVVGLTGADSSVVAVIPQGKNGDKVRIKEAYLLAAAPQLFEVCCKVNSILENNFIVTAEGFKINCTDLKKLLSDAILRAMGCRRTPDEP